MDEALLSRLKQAVRDMEVDETRNAAEKALAAQLEPALAIEKGLLPGMEEAGRLYDEGEYFIPELLMCSEALYAGMDVLAPCLKREEPAAQVKVVIGVVQGDIHDIGKNLVKVMLEAAGFKVIDLGRDVPADRFVKAVKENEAEVLCLSTLTSTTLNRMAEVIELLREQGLRDKVKVAVGGGAVSSSFAESIGADGYSDTATEAVRLIKGFFAEKKEPKM